MDPKQHIESYKNINVKDYVHSLYQAKYINSLNSVILEGAKYNKEFATIPKSIVKTLNDEYNIESPYFNLVKGNDKYKVKRKPKKDVPTKQAPRSKSKIRGGEVTNEDNASRYLTTGTI